MRQIAPILLVFAIATAARADDAKPRQESRPYSMSRSQLTAMQQVVRARGELIFTWDWNPSNPWEWEPEKKPNPIDSMQPVYGFNGNAWYTSDSTLEALQEFPELQYVNIAYCCRITDSGIAHLKKLKTLQTLVLYRNAARFGGNLLPIPASAVEDQKQLLTDTALTHIAEFSALESLHIGDNEFSESAILQLSQLNTLKHLAIDDSQISDAALARLRRDLPNCKIDVWHGRRDIEESGIK